MKTPMLVLDGIAKLQTPGHLIAVIVLTAAMAMLAMRLAEKVLKKQATSLQ